MKWRNRLTVALLVAGVALSWILFAVDTTRTDLAEKQVMLVFRDIGHRILLRAGDSTSRVMPVVKINSKVYQVEFQSPFHFVPDTLVNVVQASIAAAHLPMNYLVTVVECNTRQIIYGYRIGPEKTTLVPCLGREQPLGCYSLQIAFSESPILPVTTYYRIGVGLLAVIVVALAVTGIGYLPTRKPDQLEGTPFVELGKYSFYAGRRVLRNGETTIALTDKESRLLSVLAANQNQPIDRDRLLKEVWEDDGVIVGRSLDVFISKLRKKLLHDADIRIVNIHGKGYKLEVD